jgi:UDPglucose 6-dehydrogenase
VALLGLTFKAGTDDLRESPAIRLGQTLLARGAVVAAFDPVSLATGTEQLRRLVPGGAIVAATSAVAACADADAAVVATEWPEFAALDWAAIAPAMNGDLIIDGRRVVDTASATAAGLRVLALGVEVGGAVLQPVE